MMECMFPTLAVRTGYIRGCRCARCTEGQRAYAAELSKGRQPCAEPGCDNPRRPGSGARYCVEHARSIDYTLQAAAPQSGRRMATCAVCGVEFETMSRAAIVTCLQHRDLAQRVRVWRTRYNADDEQIKRWLSEGSICWICRRPVQGKWGETPHVDHDHRCCAGQASCGRCIRGLVHGTCNNKLGSFESFVRNVGPERAIELILATFRNSEVVIPDVSQ